MTTLARIRNIIALSILIPLALPASAQQVISIPMGDRAEGDISIVLALSPNGPKCAVVHFGTNNVVVRDAVRGADLANIDPEGRLTGLAWTPDGTHLTAIALGLGKNRCKMMASPTPTSPS